MGIYMEGSWSVGTWKQNPQLDWAFALFPTMSGPDGKKMAPRPVYSAHALVIASASQQKEAGQTFLTRVTTSPQAQMIVASAGLPPNQAEVYKPQYLAALKNRNAQTVFAQLPNSVIINDDVRTLDNLPEVLPVLNQQLNLAWTGNAKLSDETTEHDTDVASDGSILSGHGGDDGLMAGFLSAVQRGDPSLILSGPQESLDSHRMVFAAERSRRSSEVATV